MSGAHIAWAFDQDLPAEEKFVLVVLADSGGSDETRSACVPQLARMCGLAEGRLREILDALVQQRLIVLHDISSGGVQLSLKIGTRLPARQVSGPRRGHIYVVSGAHKLCKVGISTNLEQRSRVLAHGVGLEVRLIWSRLVPMDIARKAERAALENFASVRLNGEWLDVSPEDLCAWIERWFEQSDGVP